MCKLEEIIIFPTMINEVLSSEFWCLLAMQMASEKFLFWIGKLETT